MSKKSKPVQTTQTQATDNTSTNYSSSDTNWSGSSVTTIDPEQRAMYVDLYNRAKAVADRPYQAYNGLTVAGFTDPQLQAFDKAVAGVNAGTGRASLQGAIDGTRSVMGYQPLQVSTGRVIDNVGEYMNPFLQNVAGGVLSNLDRARGMTQQQNAAAAEAAKAFGGSRHGIVEAETNRNFFDVAGQQINQLFSQGYDNALATATNDLNRGLTAQQLNQAAGLQGAQLNLQGAQQLAGLSDQERRQGAEDVDILGRVGSAQQIQRQAELDDAYSRWLEERNYPVQQLGILGEAVTALPSFGSTTTNSGSSHTSGTSTTVNKGTTTTTGTQAGGGPSKASQAASTIGTIASVAMLFSDKNIKSGRKPIKDEDVLKAFDKTPVERWRYDPAKGGPDDGGREHIGPMAQSVAKNLGIGNGHAIPVVDMMGTQTAAIRALSKKVKKLEKKGGKK